MSGSLDSLCLWTSLSLRRQISKSTKTILALSITGFCGKAEKSMQPEPRRPGPSIDWLRYARADLALARVPLPHGGLYELLCFHAQQAAEKSIKAVLLHYGIEPPRTHNLERLIDLLPTSISRTTVLSQSARLTVYSTASRYPSDAEPVSIEEYQEALCIAKAVVAWAEKIIDAGQEPHR
jgi:HEPN domain-containing protein